MWKKTNVFSKSSPLLNTPLLVLRCLAVRADYSWCGLFFYNMAEIDHAKIRLAATTSSRHGRHAKLRGVAADRCVETPCLAQPPTVVDGGRAQRPRNKCLNQICG
jgi:hypothetical protein